jgi:hypothetical protein
MKGPFQGAKAFPKLALAFRGGIGLVRIHPWRNH